MYLECFPLLKPMGIMAHFLKKQEVTSSSVLEYQSPREKGFNLINKSTDDILVLLKALRKINLHSSLSFGMFI